jgi:hypothetical protein
MRGRVLVAVVVAALGAGAAGAVAPAGASGGGPAAVVACTKAKIGGQSKCIAAGQYCAKRYERDYRRYGFTCNKKDARGRWHLRRR